jgi:methylmalonyl-CoA mutase N-terminal domain/subunit
MLEQRSTESQSPVVEQGTLFDTAELERLTVKRTTWEETTLKEALERLPEHSHLVTTSSVPVQRVYMPQDNVSLDYTRDLAMPGEYPYTRGVQPTMYRARPWTMRMFAGFGTAEDTNARF